MSYGSSYHQSLRSWRAGDAIAKNTPRQLVWTERWHLLEGDHGTPTEQLHRIIIWSQYVCRTSQRNV